MFFLGPNHCSLCRPPYLTSPSAVLFPLPRLLAEEVASAEGAARSSGLTPLYSTPARTPTKGREMCALPPTPFGFQMPPICRFDSTPPLFE